MASPFIDRAYPHVLRPYLVDTGRTCAEVMVKGNAVVEAAPVYKWMVGKNWSKVKKWSRIRSITPYTGG